ncbi:MAG TPA: hypothetical protein DDY14_17170 [Chromatiaceae bacterium]|nr:MAG: hypothetical protein N838_00100 [Thiohalocapsa sp. PB-PSB1]HBG97011.1 hypothetical protein [Chromatiaceae bacterium]HCS92576.1 hypothetical protein [Chromatiaceae bacterium]
MVSRDLIIFEYVGISRFQIPSRHLCAIRYAPSSSKAYIRPSVRLEAQYNLSTTDLDSSPDLRYFRSYDCFGEELSFLIFPLLL